MIEDDPVQRDSIEAILGQSGYTTFSYSSSEEFYNRPRIERKPGCILLDFLLRGQDGLSFLKVHQERADAMPVIVLTGYADVGLAVDFMSAGASTLLVKPFDTDELINYIAQAIAWDQSTLETRLKIQHVRMSLGLLTERQRIIKNLVLQGLANKVIASQLDLSERTIELARADVLKIFGVKNAIELAVLLTQSQAPVPPFTPKSIRKPFATSPSMPPAAPAAPTAPATPEAPATPTAPATPATPSAEQTSQSLADSPPATPTEASSPAPIPDPHLPTANSNQPTPHKPTANLGSEKRQPNDSPEQQD